MNKRYFNLQLKRNFKLYPAIILITFITLLSILIAGVAVVSSNTGEDNNKAIKLGIVGDTKDTFFALGMDMLRYMEDVGLYMEFKEYSSEEDAKDDLKNNRITGYVSMPENYFNDLLQGRNNPAKYIIGNGPVSFTSIISTEVTDLVSDIVISSQTGTFTMQTIVIDRNMINLSKYTNSLFEKYLFLITYRSHLFDNQILGLSDSVSFAGYYIASFILLFMLLWGISCNGIFTSKKIDLAKLLNMSGLKPKTQVLCEYGAYLVITLTTLLIFAFFFGNAVWFADLDIPELHTANGVSCMLFIVLILPVILMITLMQNAVYELVPNTISAILTQFLITVFLGYISGLFYPSYFFPEGLQKVASFLPVGAGFNYVKNAMSGNLSVYDFGLVLGYCIVFFGVILLVRIKRVSGDAK